MIARRLPSAVQLLRLCKRIGTLGRSLGEAWQGL